MPLPGGGYSGSAFKQSDLDKFIPELWSSEIIRARNSALVMIDHVKRIPDSMKKGDVLHVPKVGRLAVNPKVAETPVSLQNGQPTEFTFLRDRYVESSFMIEDIAAIQSNYDARSIYTEEAGLALARDIDSWILAHRVVIKALNNVIDVNGNITLASILAAKLKLEQADVPLEGVKLIVSPAQYTSLLQIDQFINGFYVDNKPVVTGQVGTIFGIPVVVTNAIKKNSLGNVFRIGDNDPLGPTPGMATTNGGNPLSRYYPASTLGQWTAAQKVGGQHDAELINGTTHASLAANKYSAIMCHNDWLAFWMGIEPKVESSREVLFQADAVVTTQYYGCKVYRPECAVIIESGEAA
jgi:hypothetical protein